MEQDMTTTEMILFIWMGLHSGVLVWLLLDRDSVLQKINRLDTKLWLEMHQKKGGKTCIKN
jgi:hypothetical protein